VAFVQAIMTASVVYHLMALDVDPWFIQEVDRLRRGFLWAGKPGARGGCCLVAWDKVCVPKALGGLGFHDLRKLNAALRARWLWFQKTDLQRPWAGIGLQVLPAAAAVFHASVRITIGSGANVLFWEDAWINGLPPSAIAPDLLLLVRPGIRRSRTVQQGLPGAAWVLDVAGELTVNGLVQFLNLWTALQSIQIGTGDDTFQWKWTANGVFSSKTAYNVFFHGRTALPGAAQVWHSFAPFKVQFHAWLALRKRCWTADRLARRGLPTHTLCKLCSAAGETLDHLSLQCPFAQSVWATACQRLGFNLAVPSVQSSLSEWWPSAVEHLSRADSKMANSFIMLTLRSLWLERNARVFDDVQKNATCVVHELVGEWELWLNCKRRGGNLGDIG
jgi:hypothetical protein